MEYINPNATYDIEAFNRNFAEVERTLCGLTGYWIRPIDWLSLPALTDAHEQVVYLLCHIVPGKIPVAFRVYNAASTGLYRVDWGDGTSDTYTASNSVYAHHVYDWDKLNAPMTGAGEKQVIITVRQLEGAMEWFYIGNTTSPVLANNSAIVSITANMPLGGTIYSSGAGRLAEVYARHLKSVQTSSCAALKSLECQGVELTDVYLSNCYGLAYLRIPKDNHYTRIGISNARQMREIECNAAEASVSISNAHALTRLRLNGLRYSINATLTSMSRAALVELFQSFGTASGMQNIDVRYCPGFAELTEADFAIATGKGFTVMR